MTDTTDFVSDYCERLNDSFWAEPVNALTNLAFIVVALLLARQLSRQRESTAQLFDIILLIILLFAIGAGSFLWHTLATPWTEWADILPILAFISLYLISFLFRVVRLKAYQVIFWFILYHVFNSGLQSLLPPDTLNGSIFYLPTLAALIFITLYSHHIQHPSASYLSKASLYFVFAIIFRTIDFAVCPIWPLGTHFLWHILNAYVLYILTTALIETIRLNTRHA